MLLVAQKKSLSCNLEIDAEVMIALHAEYSIVLEQWATTQNRATEEADDTNLALLSGVPQADALGTRFRATLAPEPPSLGPIRSLTVL